MRHKKRLLKPIAVGCIVVAVPMVGSYFWYCSHYPYGWTHVCDTQLSVALRRYADDHDGAFPAGEATPEACLALLHKAPYNVNAHLLSGKSIATQVAEDALKNSGTLGPTSCSWHYVPGLSLGNSPDLALFWDKTGLGHNGQRLSGGGYIVWFIDGTRRHIPASQWDSFLAGQEVLRQAQIVD